MRKSRSYRSMDTSTTVTRREFVKTVGVCSAAAGTIVLGVPSSDAQTPAPAPPATNIDDFMKAPRGKHALPGPFPGKVVEVKDKRALVDDKPDAKVVAEMFERGVRTLTAKDMKQSFGLFFESGDIVGIKVNPVGPPLIHTKIELTQAVVRWLMDNKVPANHIVIWDRFDYMLKDAGYTPDKFPAGVTIEGLQTMDEEGNKWRDASGNHVSLNNFDRNVFYYAKDVVGKGVKGYKDDEFYLNQHVFNGEYSYFGKLLTTRLTKIVNLAAFKNTGPGISMATKNLGYGSICNTGRLHAPLFFNVCTEVLAAPVIREKLVLNVTDALRAQYEGGPDKNAQFVYNNHTLYFATDPFALDMVCHRQITAKRKEMGITVNENPRFTEYLRYAEKLGLGVVADDKVNHTRIDV
ncbi:MAG: DUF362 domain-containing protein [Acidobacteria bacterium]|nr:DUF362 domain-containing protein [Acidobacteriota bacterium]